MKITLTSLIVDNQEKALSFYTDTLDFVKQTDMPAGEYRWLTVASPDGPEGVELLLEPAGIPAARTYQAALKEAGIPATSFEVGDVRAEYERLRGRGVSFTVEPTTADWGSYAVFDDTCGNLINLHQVSRA